MPDATGTPTSPDNIPTYATAADPPSGKGFNTAMAAIQAALLTRISKPTGLAAGETVVFNGAGFDRSSVTRLGPTSLGSGTPDGTKILYGDGTWRLGSGSVLQRYTGNPLVSIASSVTETDLFGAAGTGFSLPGGTLGTTGMVRIRVFGDFLNSTGASGNFTPKIYYGASSATGTVHAFGASSATRSVFIMEFYVIALGATNSQLAIGGSPINNSTTQGAALTPTGSATGAQAGIFAIDSTAPQNLRVTATLSANSASLVLRTFAVSIEAS